MTKAPRLTCASTKQDEERRRPDQLAARAVMEPDVPSGREDGGRDEDRADPMREVHADAGVPERRHEMPERQREVRNRHPRLDMPHRRAEDDLAVDHHRRRDRDAAERRVVDGRLRLRPSRRGEERQADREAEEELREAGVADRHRRRQEQQDRDAAEQALEDDRAERGDAELAAPIGADRPSTSRSPG